MHAAFTHADIHQQLARQVLLVCSLLGLSLTLLKLPRHSFKLLKRLSHPTRHTRTQHL